MVTILLILLLLQLRRTMTEKAQEIQSNREKQFQSRIADKNTTLSTIIANNHLLEQPRSFPPLFPYLHIHKRLIRCVITRKDRIA